MPIDFDLALILAALTVALAGAVRGFAGFGAAMVMVPLLSGIYDPTTAVVSVALLEVVGLLVLWPTARRDADWGVVGRVTVAAVPLVPLGFWILSTTEPALMQRILGAVVLLSVLLLASGWRPARMGPRAAYAAGSASGFLTGLAAMGGPPVVVYLTAAGVPARSMRGTLVAYFLVVDLLALTWFAFNGRLDLGVALRCALLTPLYFVAIWAGGRGFDLASEQTFRRVALGLLTIVGVGALLR